MAASSLLSMVCLLQVDVPYSMMITVAFALGWFNIVMAIGVHLYSVTFRRKEVEQLVRAAEQEMRRRQIEELRRFDEPPILPGLPDQETLSKSEAVLEREKELLTAAA
jgi:hypothetical protein